MTDDLINRADTFDVLTDYYHIKTEAQLAKLAEAISRVPAAEPQITLESAIDFLHSIGWMQEHDRILTESTERRGKWVPYEFGNRLWHKCTACGVADKYIDQVTRADGTICELVAKRPYCPNCGARMEADCSETKVYTATPKGRTILERIKAGEGLPPLGAKMEGDE